MSSDIYAKPDLSKKVGYNRKVKDEEWEESEVVIYESADVIRDDHADIQSHKEEPLTEKHPPAVQTRPFRAAACCLGMLCFLMLMGIIILAVQYLSVNHSQLQDEVKQLKGKIEEKWCPNGWTRFGCSCYFKSDKKKRWDESRNDCQKKGADLVVINNKEEQEFVIKMNMDGDSWIGLRATKETLLQQRRRWEYEWVDSSPLTEMFWASGLPRYDNYQHAATCCNQQGQWTQSRSYGSKNWICEK